ncbi:MAG: glycosyltransferase family 4 protein [Acidimicrobiia bacterium]|nr:glycosyltransferase family 4 protein [Acidimicrobiia bacterium]
MTRPTPVLFVSHEGSRTGAPFALLHLVRWLADNSSIEPHIAILRDGPLTEMFAEVGPTTVLGTEVEWPGSNRSERWLAERQRRRPLVALQVARMRRTVAPVAAAHTVYLNSAASVRLLHHLPAATATVAHVHELRSAATWALRPADRPLLHTRIDHFIAAADCVADNLVVQFDVPRRRITRVYEFIDPTEVLAPPERNRQAIRDELGLPDSAFVVGGSGWADWRKGIDLFTQLGRAMVDAGRSDVHLVWVGGLPGGADGEQIRFDIERSGAAAHIHLVGLQSRPHDWYRGFDVLALTSREDPYPLVGLETSLLGIPMVCFDRSGGMVELVRRSEEEARGESGMIVPYLDVEAMAAAVLTILDDEPRRVAMGARAAATVERDHRVDVAGPEVLDVIERVLARRSTGGRS